MIVDHVLHFLAFPYDVQYSFMDISSSLSSHAVRKVEFLAMDSIQYYAA
jgi:hypothetical protein